jgi:GTP-binding protein HflX
MDLLTEQEILKDPRAEMTFQVSAKTGQNVSSLLEGVSQLLKEKQVLIEKLFTYDKAGDIQLIRKFGQLISEEYTEDGIVVKAYVPSEVYGRIM